MFLRNKHFQRMSGGFLEHLSAGVISSLQMLFLGMHKDAKTLKMLRKVRRERTGPLANEGFLLYAVARAQRKVSGDFAELGVFRGASARIICEAKGDKRMFLLDTFQGLPEVDEAQDGKAFRKHQYACGQESVEAYLKDCGDLHFCEGLFPDSIRDVPEIQLEFCKRDWSRFVGTEQPPRKLAICEGR